MTAHSSQIRQLRDWGIGVYRVPRTFRSKRSSVEHVGHRIFTCDNLPSTCYMHTHTLRTFHRHSITSHRIPHENSNPLQIYSWVTISGDIIEGLTQHRSPEALRPCSPPLPPRLLPPPPGWSRPSRSPSASAFPPLVALRHLLRG